MSDRGLGRIVTFYSYKGGTGRSMALANVAWILASNGMRVLAVDWDLESPGLHRYFHPFLVDRGRRSLPGVIDLVWDFATAAMVSRPLDDTDWLDDHAQILRYAVSLDRDFAHGGTLDFVAAGHNGSGYSVRVSRLDWDVLYQRQGGGAFMEKLRENMRANYDYVLIDSRTGLSDTAGICTVVLPDMLVNCFTMSTQSIDGAVMVAGSVRDQVDRDLRIFPVPMRIEDAEKTKLEAGRDYARSRFASFLTDLDHEAQERYWGDVEVPYKTFYAYEEILATIGDRPRQENTLLSSFERLAGVLTGGRVRELVAMPEPERRSRLAEFERTKPSLPSDVFLSHTEQDRMWAEWVAHQLEEEGYRVVRQGADFPPGADVRSEIEQAVNAAACTVVILSPDYMESPFARITWDAALARDPLGNQSLLLPVRVVDFRPPGIFDSRVSIEFAGLTADQAREELLAATREPGLEPSGQPREPGPGVDPPRFPGDQPAVFQVPLRNPNFVGRDAVLLELRAHLAKSSTAAVLPQTLHGLAGVGKTQVALEFAHRFAPDYDLVWWISAEQVSEARSSLTALAPHLGFEPSDDASETQHMVLDALRRGDPFRRWLLVFDNAGAADDIKALLPQGPGHVLITSRDQDWSAVADTVEVDAFTRDESVALLLRRGRGIERADAGRLADRLGDLPLAIEQAAVWQAETGMPVDEYLTLFEQQVARLLSEGTPTNYPASVAATWGIAFDRLARRSPAAIQLLELCAFFGAEPIPFSWLKMGRFAPSLPSPLDETISDDILRRRAVREIGRYALARVDPGRDTLVVHRLVQAVLRDRLSAEQRGMFRRGAHELMAAANPGNPDNDQTWEAHAELSPHILPSGAIDGKTPEIRRVVVDQVRYRYRRGDIEASQDLGETAQARWLESLGADDEQTLTLSMWLADALWWLGEITQARELRQDTLARLRHRFGEDHEIFLITANGVGGDLRASGRFEDARAHDEEYLARHRRVFGDDDPNTLRSANNLAADLRLLGDIERAQSLDQDTLERRRRALRPWDSEVLSSISAVARNLIGLGEYAAAQALLNEHLADFRQFLGARHNEVLRATRTLMVASRKAGAHEEARAFAEESLALHRGRFGDDHLLTAAAMVSTSQCRHAVADVAGARELGEMALRTYRTGLGNDHPFTLAAMTNLAIVLRAAGELTEARSLDETAVAGLERTMGRQSSYTLSALGNLANDLSVSGDHEAARRTSEVVVEGNREVRGEIHPYTLGSLINLAFDLEATGARSAAERLRSETLDRLTTVLGGEHPDTKQATAGVRTEFDIEPSDL